MNIIIHFSFCCFNAGHWIRRNGGSSALTVNHATGSTTEVQERGILFKFFGRVDVAIVSVDSHGMIWSPNIFSMLPKARIPSGQFGQSVPVNSSITKRLVGAKARFLIEYPVVFSSSSKVISNVNLFAMPTLSGRAFWKAKSYLSPFFKERPDSLISSMALPLASS